jgi:hypothetical protein
MKEDKKLRDAYIDQNNNVYYARSRKELSEQISGKVNIMYNNNHDGTLAKVGYVIGWHWLTKYSLTNIK